MPVSLLPTLPIHLAHQLVPVATALSLFASVGSPAQNEAEKVPEVGGSIYFDAWQLEKEILISPAALQEWLDLGVAPDTPLDAAGREALKPKIGKFLATRCPISISGQPIEFTLDRIHFVQPNSSAFILIEAGEVVTAAEVRISATFAAPNPDLSAPLQVQWDLFPPSAATIQISTADVAGTRAFPVTSDKPTFTVLGRYKLDARAAPKAPAALVEAGAAIPWLSLLLMIVAIPVVIRIVRTERSRGLAVALLIVLAGGAAVAKKYVHFTLGDSSGDEGMTAEKSRAIMDPLLRGIYHAFNYREESAQYDVLGRVVGGEALTNIYLEVRRTLESRQRDGSRVRVNDLTIEKSDPTPLDGKRGFASECTWEVSGRVGHWGHFHDRTNRYNATFTIEPIEDTWKITGLTLHSRDREDQPAD